MRISGDRKREIDKIMFDQTLFGMGGERYDVPEDMYWMWYDTDEMTDIDKIYVIYAWIDEYFKNNNIR